MLWTRPPRGRGEPTRHERHDRTPHLSRLGRDGPRARAAAVRPRDRRRGRAVPRRGHDAGRRPGDRRAGRLRGGRRARRRRPRRPVRPRGLRRRALAVPGAARAGAPAATPRGAARRPRRRARRARRDRLRAAAPLRRLHRPVRGRRHRLLLRLAHEAAGQRSRGAARVRRLPGARADRRRRGDRPVERADGRRGDGDVRARGRQQRCAQAGRADAHERRARRRAGARGGDPARRLQRRPGHRSVRRGRDRRAPGGRRDHVHRLGPDRPRDPGRGCGAREARLPRARRQEPVDHLPRRRPRGRDRRGGDRACGARRARCARAGRACSCTRASATR